MKKVAVLCRGKSLKHINMLPDIDEYVIVNRFGEELEDERISQKIGDSPITHILSPATGELDLMLQYDSFNKFNINEIVFPYAKETVPPHAWNIRVEGKNGILPMSNLSEKIKPYMWTPETQPDIVKEDRVYEFNLPTSGIAGICHASIELDYDEIHIIGMDFYDVGYAYGSEFSSIEAGRTVALHETEPMKHFLSENLCKRLPNKNFHMYTYSDYNPNLENLHITKFVEELDND
tara:strand:- start:1083 stop:1787 length:705 start_codon:yes stop_codon:yes gene_type:complete